MAKSEKCLGFSLQLSLRERRSHYACHMCGIVDLFSIVMRCSLKSIGPGGITFYIFGAGSIHSLAQVLQLLIISHSGLWGL
jgi:predicted RNA-binding Zn-ribbon protein involved in translation (DUF1610 family)